MFATLHPGHDRNAHKDWLFNYVTFLFKVWMLEYVNRDSKVGALITS